MRIDVFKSKVELFGCRLSPEGPQEQLFHFIRVGTPALLALDRRPFSWLDVRNQCTQGHIMGASLYGIRDGIPVRPVRQSRSQI